MTPTYQKQLERQDLVCALRNQGLTFREIGARLGVTRQQASKLHLKAVRRLTVCPPHWTDGLSTRLRHTLLNLNITSRAEARAWYESGRLHPEKIRNYGPATNKEMAAWLGLPPLKVPVTLVHVKTGNRKLNAVMRKVLNQNPKLREETVKAMQRASAEAVRLILDGPDNKSA